MITLEIQILPDTWRFLLILLLPLVFLDHFEEIWVFVHFTEVFLPFWYFMSPGSGLVFALGDHFKGVGQWGLIKKHVLDGLVGLDMNCISFFHFLFLVFYIIWPFIIKELFSLRHKRRRLPIKNVLNQLISTFITHIFPKELFSLNFTFLCPVTFQIPYEF